MRYVAASAPIRSILLLLALVSLTGIPYAVLMPVFASRVLGGGPHTLGLLMAASGAGAVAGALWLASRRSVLGLGRTLTIAATLFGAGLVAFSFSRWLWLSMIALAIAGGGMMIQMAASNTLLQTIVDEDKRGRVMSFYTMAFFGMAPFGSLLAGWLGDRIGATATVRWGGVATVLGAALFARKLPELRRLLRPLYVRLGILPEIAEGLSATAEMTRPPEE
jgi:MFS family permease